MANYKMVNADQLDADLTAVADKIRAKGNTTEQLTFPAGYEAAIEAISTGVELNFDVLAYATEAELLAAAPKENVIGIITDVPLNGWAFSTTEPEPVEGMVWITTGTSSAVEFNALKKNTVMVYPLSAAQYVDGAWVDVPAMSYQGGEWASWWNGELYDTGNQYPVAGGNWNTSGFTFQSYTPISATINPTNMVIDATAGSGNRFSAVCKSKPVDVTSFNTLFITAQHTENKGWAWGGLGTSGTNMDTGVATGDFLKNGTVLYDGTLSIDISALRGEFYPYVCASIGGKLQINKIWME